MKNKYILDEIKEMLEHGSRYTEIAQVYGITKQRVQQIVKTHCFPTSVEVSRNKKSKAHFDRWGNRDTSDLYQVCRQKFRAKKSNAKITGQEWTVVFGDIDWPTHCPVLGLELDYFAETRAENSPSFDRYDSSKGYVTGNVQIISWRANRIKNDGTVEEHEKIVEYLRRTP